MTDLLRLLIKNTKCLFFYVGNPEWKETKAVKLKKF